MTDWTTALEAPTGSTSVEPFFYFEAPAFFTDERWAELEATYPRLADFSSHAQHAVGSKRYVNDRSPSFGAVVAERPAWRELVDELRSAPFLTALHQICAPHLAHRPPWERLRWCLAADPAVGRGQGRGLRVPSVVRHLGRTPVRVGIEFSYLASDARIPPHTDVAGKLLSLMLYFPYPGQEDEPLGTEFYRGRPGMPTWRRWNSSMPDDAETAAFLEVHECFYRTPFHPNTLVGFLKNDVSWHGLAPIPEGSAERRALIVNVFRSLR